MYEMNEYMPVRVISGDRCIASHAEHLIQGTRCLIVTGAHSAKASGALDDVTDMLTAHGIAYSVFDRIGENPLLSVCREGGLAAVRAQADFVVGIGGGSPLDAAKAVAAFAQNPSIAPMELFRPEALCPSLPLVLIPTTAGTGSEVNPYSILTLDAENRKKTFNSPHSYAKCAFLDGRYLQSMKPASALSCALDAFCHCIESYLSPKTTVLSAAYALNGGAMLWNILKGSGAAGLTVTEENRSTLLYAASLGGLAINTTGTGFPHPLGYNLTLKRGIPHGRACAVFTGEYIRHAMATAEGSARLATFSDFLGTTPETVSQVIPSLSGVHLTLTDDEIRSYDAAVCSAGNFANCVAPLPTERISDIYRRLFA